MSNWLDERRKDDERHSERNRKADDYDRLASEVQRLRLTDEEQRVLRQVVAWGELADQKDQGIVVDLLLRHNDCIQQHRTTGLTMSDGVDDRSAAMRGSAMQPVAWKLVETCSGKVIRRSKNRVLVAGWRRVTGATVVPVYATLRRK